MDFIRDTLVRSVVVYVMIYAWQIVKSWIIGEINPTVIDVILSVVVGWILASLILNKLN